MNNEHMKNPLARLLIYPDCFISLYLNSGLAIPITNIKANEPQKHLFFLNRKKLADNNLFMSCTPYQAHVSK